MTFSRPEYLWLLGAVLLAAGLHAVGDARRRRLAAAFPPLGSPAGRRRKAACFLAGLLLTALGAAGPEIGTEAAAVPAPAPHHLVIALDCSRSMLARDLAPDRLGAAKALVLDVLARLPGVRAGLVAFAGRAWLACPVTADRTALALFLETVSPGEAPLGGTNPAAALEASRLALAGIPGGGAVLLVSDGEATVAGDAPWPADTPLLTVAVGGPAPTPVPDGSGGYLRDAAGRPVLAGVDAAALAAMAGPGGAFRLAPDAPDPAGAIAKALTPLRGADVTPAATNRPADRTGLFLALGLALLLADLLQRPAVRPLALLPLLLLPIPAIPAQAGMAAAENVAAGLAAWDRGEHETALARFLAARARDPDDPAIAYDIGAANYRLGRFAKARAAFARAVRTATGGLRARALYNQGNAAYRLGDADEAARLYEAALAVDPADADARANLDWLRSRKSGGEKPDAAPDEEGKNGRRDGQEGTADTPGRAPAPLDGRKGPDGRRQDGETAMHAPRPDAPDNPEAPAAPVSAREGQVAGQRRAETAGRADDPILDRVPDLAGLPATPAYGRPAVEKDW